MEFDSSEDTACCICCDEETYENDEIYYCDLCNAPTHQTCYGSELVVKKPEGKIKL